MPAVKAVFLAASLAASTSLAQDGPGRKPVQERATQQPQSGAPSVPPPSPVRPDLGPVLTIEFPGGTVGEYVDALRHSSSQPVNIVLPPRAAKVPMPGVSLKTVTLLDALNAVLAVADIPADEEWGVRPLATLGMGGMSGFSGDAIPGFAIMTQGRGPRMAPGMMQAAPGPVPMHTEVYAIRDLLDSGLKADAVLTSIDAALKMDQRSEPPDIKFHEEAGLLILRATNEQLDAARQVITRLSESARSASHSRAAVARRDQIERLKAEMDPLYDRLAKARSDATAQRSALNTLAIRNPTTAENAEKVQADINSEQARLAQAEIVVDRLERELRSREQLMQQLRAAELGMSGEGDPGAEIARLRAENAELRERLDKLEKKAR